MPPTRVRRITFSCLLLHIAAASAHGQASGAAPATTGPQLNVSGIIVGSFQYRLDEASRATNRFELDRAYLNFRLPAGERTSIRVTTDVYQQQRSGDDAYYAGWAIRAKYAYIQHDFLKGKEWSAYGRVGMLNTVLIEHIENFWPRFLSQVAVERAGFFSSADLGVSAQVGLPRKLGEAVAAITNGPGYTSRERDRFKDYAARVSLTPLSSSTSPLTRSLTLSVWGYKGALGSRFAAPSAGQVGPVNEALRRDRYGVFAGVKDPRLTLGVEYAQRFDEGETGSNTTTSPRVVIDSSGTVRSAFAVVRPLQLLERTSTSPLSLVARRDWVTVNNNADRGQTVSIVGALWDLSKRTTLALDYQIQLPDANTDLPLVKTVFLHYAATF